jgi:hypothetical protein
MAVSPSPNTPPCSSPSASSEPLSSTSSSSLQITPLAMARPPSTDPRASRVSPPGRTAVDLPRPQVASRGGCWYVIRITSFLSFLPLTFLDPSNFYRTCRLRRKVSKPSTRLHLCPQFHSPQKCDEQRQGDSCHTCIRLKIKCLGWGSRRPDWMRVSHLSSSSLRLYDGRLTPPNCTGQTSRRSLQSRNQITTHSRWTCPWPSSHGDGRTTPCGSHTSTRHPHTVTLPWSIQPIAPDSHTPCRWPLCLAKTRS